MSYSEVMEPDPPRHTSFDTRAFGWALAVSLGGPLVLLLLLRFVNWESETAITLSVGAAGVWLLAMLGLVIYGIVDLIRGKTPTGLALLLGCVAGAVVGFGTCMGVLGA